MRKIVPDSSWRLIWESRWRANLESLPLPQWRSAWAGEDLINTSSILSRSFVPDDHVHNQPSSPTQAVDDLAKHFFSCVLLPLVVPEPQKVYIKKGVAPGIY